MYKKFKWFVFFIVVYIPLTKNVSSDIIKSKIIYSMQEARNLELEYECDDEYEDETDEEKEAQFEAFLELLKEKRKIPDLTVLNIKRLKEMEKTYTTLKKIILSETPDAKITYGVVELNMSVGYITVEADEIIVRDIKNFLNSMRCSSNFEIYPIKNNKIRFSITFHGIMTNFERKP